MQGGYLMLADIRVPEQRETWRTGLYEDRVLSPARRLVPDNGVFVDFGANVGFYTCGVGFDLLRRVERSTPSSRFLRIADGF